MENLEHDFHPESPRPLKEEVSNPKYEKHGKYIQEVDNVQRELDHDHSVDPLEVFDGFIVVEIRDGYEIDDADDQNYTTWVDAFVPFD